LINYHSNVCSVDRLDGAEILKAIFLHVQEFPNSACCERSSEGVA